MLQKTKNILKKFNWHELRDVRTLGMFVFLAIALLTSWSSIRIIETNYELQQQIARLEQQNRLQQLENENTRLSNKYYETETYLELAARNFNKAKKGEELVIVPDEVAKKHAPHIETALEDNQEHQNKPKYRQNLEDWIDFLFRSSS